MSSYQETQKGMDAHSITHNTHSLRSLHLDSMAVRMRTRGFEV